MRIAEADILMLPGLGNSGPGHWQHRWAVRMPTARFVEQADWHRPRRADWVQRIEHDIMMATRPVVLVAHSLGVAAAVHTAQRLKDTKVRGALLVAAPDMEAQKLPPEIGDFRDVPRDPLPFPSLLVASSDDPWCTLERSVDMATCWGSELHVAQNAGHLNIASGHGPWPEGLVMFTRLMQRLKG